MSEFYYVDRKGGLEPGTVLDLAQLTRPEPISEQGPVPNPHYQIGGSAFGLQHRAGEVLEDLFPQGLTRHGVNYASGFQPKNYQHEAVFELVRQADFPDRTSRFQCYFGCESLEDARTFSENYGEGRIWLVSSDSYARADMKLLQSFPFWMAIRQARLYWRGETNKDDPFWEVLMEPPVHVLELVDEGVTGADEGA